MKKFYIIILCSFVQYIFGMRSTLKEVFLNGGFINFNTQNCYSSPNDLMTCYGTHGIARNRIEQDYINRQPPLVFQLKPRCHAEVFLLESMRNERNLNGCYIVIEQPYPPCVTPLFGTYYNANYKKITEFNPGETCNRWVQNFAINNHCTIVFKCPGRNVIFPQ